MNFSSFSIINISYPCSVRVYPRLYFSIRTCLKCIFIISCAGRQCCAIRVYNLSYNTLSPAKLMKSALFLARYNPLIVFDYMSYNLITCVRINLLGAG
ncbi:hypothetical protein MCHI_000686 [Candidatus Magnetoovum chiemensis]|nr:hypothetical protein MCHI_000686 [Candidatus Magnetoovum chiemensis]